MARWFLAHSAIYLVASVVIAIFFVVAAGIYSFFAPAQPVGATSRSGLVVPIVSLVAVVLVGWASIETSLYKTWAGWIVKAAARRVQDSTKSAEYQEEWIAHLNSVKGAVPTIIYAFGVLIAAGKIRKQTMQPRAEEKEQV
jgi:hypothetical protein